MSNSISLACSPTQAEFGENIRPIAPNRDEMGLHFHNRVILDRITQLRTGADMYERINHRAVTELYRRVMDEANIYQELCVTNDARENELARLSGGRVYQQGSDENMEIIRERYQEWLNGDDSSLDDILKFLRYAEQCYKVQTGLEWQKGYELQQQLEMARQRNQDLSAFRGRFTEPSEDDEAWEAIKAISTIALAWFALAVIFTRR